MTVKVGPEDAYTDVVKQYETVIPANANIAWFLNCPSRQGLKDAIVVLFFQGGGFVTATSPGKSGSMPSCLFTSHLSATRSVQTT